MKITIKTGKPRNPLIAPMKQRQAGAHGAYQANRRNRRAEKHALRLAVKKLSRPGDADA